MRLGHWLYHFLYLFLSAISILSFSERSASAQAAPADATAAEPGPAEAQPAEASQPDAAAPDSGTILGIIRSPDLDAPVAGATVTIAGTSLSATTDEAGRFRLSAPAGRVTLRASSTGFRAVERQLAVAAGASIDIELSLSLDSLLTQAVVVVGSRTPRTTLETTVPVDVVTAEDIAHIGRTETGRILSAAAPSFVSTPQTVSDGTDHVDPASLRGLGPDQVLVLVNGKRRHKSALVNVNGTFGRGTVGTDLNAIPAGSIKRIEILRDGAASQYGSDAIAGVINIVTKDTTDELDVTTTTGITGSGDGGQIKTSGNYGIKLGKHGFLNVTGEFLKKDATNRAGAYTGNVFTSPTQPSASAPNPYFNGPDPAQIEDNRILAQRGLTRDDFRMKIGEAAAEDALGSYNLELPIDDATAIYSFGDLGHRSGAAAGFYRFPNQFSQTVQPFYPNGFLPEIHSNINDLGVTVGIRRKGDWTVDLSLTHGRNSFQFNVENSVNASLGTLSPTTFDAGTLTSEETLGDLDLQRKIDTGVLRSLTLVLGMEVRNERYAIGAGDPASYEFGLPGQPPAPTQNGSIAAAGAQVFPGFQPSNEVDRSRNNVGVYAGFESEIVKGLNVDVGARYEHYSDFGNSFTAKAAARIPLGSAIGLRGAVSTGFRAPSLQQLWFNNISSVFIIDPATNSLLPNTVLTSNNESPITKAFGIPKLNEEKSTNVSAGVTLRPFANFSLTADGYFIRIKDRVVLTSTFPTTNMVVKSILAPFPGVTQAQFFANAVDTDTEGLDLVADYALDTGAGTLTFGAAANFTRTEVQAVHLPESLSRAFQADPSQLSTFFFGRLATSRLEDAVPRQKGYAQVRYSHRGLSAQVRADYYGSVKFLADDPMNDESFGAKTLFDIDVGYQITRNLHLAVGADNVFNTFPDRQTKAANISSGRFIYSRNVSQFGQNGGFYYSRLELTF